MSILKQPRVSSRLATSALCVLLASVIAQGLSNEVLKKKPSVVLVASTTTITYPCQRGFHSTSRSCPSTADFQVALTAVAKNFNKQPLYAYTVTGGRVVGEGSKMTWDLSGVAPGVYTAAVEVQDNKKHRALSSTIVTMMNCGDCVDSLCPTLVVACYDEVKAGTLAVCTVMMRPSSDLVTYDWSANVSSGEDLSGRISGRGTSISIRTDGLGGQHVTATVKVKGLDLSCSGIASGSTVVKP